MFVFVKGFLATQNMNFPQFSIKTTLNLKQAFDVTTYQISKRPKHEPYNYQSKHPQLMSKKNSDKFELNLQTINQSSSPNPKKRGKSPVRPNKTRVNLGGFSDTYRSFFKRQNQVQGPNSKVITQKVQATQSLAQKQKIIQDLQQKIMKQTIKKNAREKSYTERIKTNWRSRIETLIRQFMRIGLYLCRGNAQVSRSVLTLLFKCNQKKNRVQKLKLIMHWISLWLKPIFAMISWVCNKNIA